MADMIPPGPKYVASLIPRALISPTITYALLALIWPTASAWVTAPLYVLSFPAMFAFNHYWAGWRDKREAYKHGAVLIPKIPDPRWGGRTVLAKMMENAKTGYIGEEFRGFTEKYGPTVFFSIMFQDRLFTTEPEYVKAILATQFDSFDKGPDTNGQFNSLLGTGVFNSDGDMWKFHRSMTRPFFSKDRISHFDIFDDHAEHAIRLIRQRISEGWPIDIQDAVSRFTLDSASDFLFGHNVNSLSAGLPYPSASLLPGSPEHLNNSDHPSNLFAQAFADAQNLTANRLRMGPSWPLQEFWEDKVKVHMDVVNKFIEPIVEDAIAKKRERGGTTSSEVEDKAREVADGETLLDHLANYTEDKKIIMDETMNIMIAGRDTTASTLTFAMYLLAEHPQFLARLRAEVLEYVGPDRRPSYEDLRQMKLMRAFINETLRLYPAVPINARRAKQAAIWAPTHTSRSSQPFYVPANTNAVYSVFLMHRRKDLWGPDAGEFDPDRWLDDRLARVTKNPFMFMPFNAGPRICLGQQFAYNETSFMLVRFLQAFSGIALAPEAHPIEDRTPEAWKNSDGPQAKEKIWPRSHLTMYARGGLWVTLEDANAGVAPQ
ncbi:hypothetical protein PLICRDRAFT_174617 [Plicaturopsis crispa FD-325 SS-3]|nr:hypothetical protein PLICRDRAFT_174617 [Plicaturopsis crispa FD-325 SS-3]